MEKNYRLLNPHEVTKATDEFWHSINEEWYPVDFSREGELVGDHIVRREMDLPTPESQLDIIELALCESTFIFPQPNQLYRFYVGDGCEKCAAIDNVYKQLGL